MQACHFKVFRVILMLAGLLLTTLAPGQTEKSLRVGLRAPLDSLHPYRTTLVDGRFVHFLLHRSLVELQHDWTWKCQLCEEIPNTKNQRISEQKTETGKRWVTRWRIKDGVRWGDGTSLTPTDVVFSWRVAQAFARSDERFLSYNNLESVEADPNDPRGLLVSFLTLEYDFYRALNFPLMPSSIEQPIFEKYPSDLESYIRNSKYTSSYKLPGLYTGPYVADELTAPESLTLKAALQANAASPSSLPTISVHYFRQEANLAAQMKEGKINFAPQGALTHKSIQDLLGKENALTAGAETVVPLTAATETLEHLDFNLRNPILSDSRLRRALWLGTNVPALLAAAEIPDALMAKSFFHPSDPATPAVNFPQGANLAAAAELLAAAGWELKSKVRVKNGQQLKITIETNQGQPRRLALLKALTEQWRQLGVQVISQPENDQTFFGTTIRRADFRDMALFAWVSQPDTPPRVIMHSREIPSQENGYNGQNVTGWRNTSVDRALDSLTFELDPEKRRAHLRLIAELFVQDMPSLPLYFHTATVLAPKWLDGLTWGGHAVPPSLGAERWGMPPTN